MITTWDNIQESVASSGGGCGGGPASVKHLLAEVCHIYMWGEPREGTAPLVKREVEGGKAPQLEVTLNSLVGAV